MSTDPAWPADRQIAVKKAEKVLRIFSVKIFCIRHQNNNHCPGDPCQCLLYDLQGIHKMFKDMGRENHIVCGQLPVRIKPVLRSKFERWVFFPGIIDSGGGNIHTADIQFGIELT